MTAEKRELTDQELALGMGGAGSSSSNKRKIYDRKNQLIGYQRNPRTPIRFVPCDKCGKPMHSGFLGWYCDPCNRHLCNVNAYNWPGTVEELIAAANAQL